LRMRKNEDIGPEIRKLQNVDQARQCARLMSSSEPWITLRRDYDFCLRMLTDPAREVYVALLKEELVGFIMLIMRGAFVGFIQTVAVKPEWRSLGIGTALLQFAEKRIFKDMSNVFMCVSSFNDKAQRLYKRLGYQTIGELKDFIVPGHSEILLRKTIGPLSEFKPTGDVSQPGAGPKPMIRTAKTSDVERMCDLYYEFHEFHVRGIPDRLVALEKIDSHHAKELRRNLRKIMRSKSSVILVAEIANQMVGLAEVHLREDKPHPAKVSYRHGHLQSLVVSRAFRRRGVGRQLVEVAEKWAKEKGASEMRLDIWEFGEGPLHFYERLGYHTLRRNLVRRL
jgi:ribosomal-protein-alanine N-acetyltransferase